MSMSPRLLRPRSGSLLLDKSTSASAAFSLRAIKTAYSARSLVQVRRSSDNAESSFTATQIADGTLSAWIGAGNTGHIKTWHDQSGNVRDAAQSTSTNQPKFSAAQTKFSAGSVLFDAATLWLDASDTAGPKANENFTFDGWIYPTAVTGVDRVIVDVRGTLASGLNGPNGTGIVWFITTDAKLRAFGNGNGSSATLYAASTSAISANAWSHIALVSASGTVTYYINGTSAGSFSATTTDSKNFRIGCRQDGTSGLAGYIDGIRCVRGAALYTSNFSPPEFK